MSVDKKTTKKGNSMWVLQLEDLTGRIEVTYYGGKVSYEHLFIEGNIVTIQIRLRIEEINENVLVRAVFQSMKQVELPEYSLGEPIILKYDFAPNEDVINVINDIIEANPGDSLVYIEFPQQGHIVRFKFNKPTNLDAKEFLLNVS